MLVGDLNTSRSGKIFGLLAEKYKDNISSEYKTCLDQKLHQAVPLLLMVDGLFSSEGCSVNEIKLQDGVSDHCVICATISLESS